MADVTRRAARVTRSRILFAAGLIGVAVETLYSLRYHQTPDSALLILFATMMGLPIYFSQDAKGHNDDAPPSVDPNPAGKHPGRRPDTTGDHGTS